MTTRYKVTMTTNALAANPGKIESVVFPGAGSRVQVRHNGGKVVIVTTSDPAYVEARLDASHSVATYEVA